MAPGRVPQRFSGVLRVVKAALEALADGLCDCLLAHVYERRFRPEEKLHQPWLDTQWRKVERALDLLNGGPPKLPKKITAGQIALRAALGYLTHAAGVSAEFVAAGEYRIEQANRSYTARASLTPLYDPTSRRARA